MSLVARGGEKKNAAFHFYAGASLEERFAAALARLELDKSTACREALDLYLTIAETAPELRALDLRVYLRDAIARARSSSPNKPESPHAGSARKSPKR